MRVGDLGELGVAESRRDRSASAAASTISLCAARTARIGQRAAAQMWRQILRAGAGQRAAVEAGRVRAVGLAGDAVRARRARRRRRRRCVAAGRRRKRVMASSWRRVAGVRQLAQRLEHAGAAHADVRPAVEDRERADGACRRRRRRPSPPSRRTSDRRRRRRRVRARRRPRRRRPRARPGRSRRWRGGRCRRARAGRARRSESVRRGAGSTKSHQCACAEPPCRKRTGGLPAPPQSR